MSALRVLLLAVMCAFGGLAAAQEAADPIEITSAARHASAISGLAVTPDGRFFVSASQDRTLILWDRAAARSIRTFRGHTEEIMALALAPGGQVVASGGRDKTARLWDLRTGRLLLTVRGHADEFRALAFLRGGDLLASGGSDKTLRIWDARTGAPAGSVAVGEEIGALAALPDGQGVLVGGSRSIFLVDVARRQVVRTYKEHTGGIQQLAVSPDGQTFASASGDGTYRLWKVEAGRSFRTVRPHGTMDELTSAGATVDAIAIAPDGRTLATAGSDQTAKIWDMESGRLLVTMKAAAGPQANSGGVMALAYTPDGTTLITGDLDGAIKLWDARTGARINTIEAGGGYSAAALAPALGLTATRDPDQTVRLWDYRSGRMLQSFAVTRQEDGSAKVELAFAPDGRTLSVTLAGTVEVWDTQTGARRQVVRLGQNLWNPLAGRVQRKPAGTGTVYGTGFSPDGRILLLGGEAVALPTDDMKIWVADPAGGKVVRTLLGHRSLPATGEPGISAVNAFAFSPDGRLVASGGDDDKAILWETAGWRRLQTLSGHAGAVDVLAFSPDGTRLATAGADQSVRIWDVATGRPLSVLLGHSDAVNAVAFDGNRVLASASKDLTIKYWDVASGALLATRVLLGGDNWVTLTREGFFDYAGEGAAMLSVVKGTQSFSIGQFFQALYRPDLVREALAGDPRGLVRDAAGRLNLEAAIRTGDAPEIRLAAPQDGATVTGQAAEVTVAIADRGGGIGRVEWRVNGVTAGLDEPGPARPRAQDGALRLTRRLAVGAGETTIEVLAYNAAGLIASRPARLRLRAEAAPAAPGRLFVLAIGINAYADARIRLGLAVADARAVGEALTKAGEGVFAGTQVTTLLDAQARRDRIEAAVEAMAARMQPGDAFVFYAAGHGKTVDGRYYFVPQDFRTDRPVPETAIPQEQWQRWFARLPARRSVLLFDTCESGSFTGDRTAERGLERDAAAARLGQATGRTILAASAGDEQALEGFRDHGLFTYALLEAVERADADGDGRIETAELAAYVYAAVTDLSQRVFGQRQSPQIRILGGRQTFVRAMRVLPEAEPSVLVARAPTHRMKAAADLLVEPAFGMPAVESLAAGSPVTLVRTDGTFSLVARGGAPIGYLAPGVLESMR